MKSVSASLPLLALGMLLLAEPSWTCELPPANAAKTAVERGKALLDEEDYPAAVAAFGEALRLDRKSVPAYIGRGTAYRCLGKPDQRDRALADFNEALRLDPKNSEAHRGRGAVYGSRKDFEKASTECEQAIRCDPNNAAAYRTRGVLHLEKGESDKALADFDKAIRLNSKDAWTFYDRAIEESRKGEFDKAISDLSEAIKIAPANYSQLFCRGQVYEYMSEWDKAIADFADAIRLKQGKAETLVARGTLFHLRGDFDHAISDMREALRLNLQCGDAYRLRAAAYEKKGDTRKADADFARAGQLQLKAVMEDRGLARPPASKAAIDSTEKRIRKEVKRLEYPAAVAQELVAMTRDWNLATLERKLAAAKHQRHRGKPCQDKLSQAQQEIAETLSQELAAVVHFKDDVFELDEAVQGKRACCMGVALMFTVLGRSIGLDVQAIDVPITAGGPTIDARRHMACLVHFADGRAAIVDAIGSPGHDVLVSKPFQFAETYRRRGSYWELKDPRNPFALHLLVQPLAHGAVIAEILLCRAGQWRAKGDLKRAQAMVAEVIRRNPGNAAAYYERGHIHEVLGEHDRAIADYGAEIQHNPLSARAYMCQGRVYAVKGQVGSGIVCLDEAIRLNPKLAAAYAMRGWALSCLAAEDTIRASSADQDKSNSTGAAKRKMRVFQTAGH